MNRNITIIGGVAIVILIGVIVLFMWNPPQQQTDESAKVQDVTTQFGTVLKNVSLLAPNAKDQIQQHYSPYVTPELLSEWMQEISKAPGRLTSSPYPDRIEIDSIQRQDNNTYTGTGDIIQVTSANTSDAALKTPITFTVVRRNEGWRISSFTMDISQTAFTVQGLLTRTGSKWYLTPQSSATAGARTELDLSNVTLQNKFLYNGQTVSIEGTSTNNDVIKVLTINIVNAMKGDLIWAASPLPNQVVKSALTVSGRARGNWFFEASFPVKLLDANGNVLAQAPAQAQGEWMTTEYVPFSVTLTFQNTSLTSGTLVLEKDNPSGLPENADELRIPVKFQ